MTGPLFTVVMPAHNAERTVGAAISSVLVQTCESWELVVVDDGSADATREIVRSFADPRVRAVAQPQQGQAAARNAALAVATGRYVALLDSDDLWLPGYLDAVARTFERDPEAGFTHADAFILDDVTRLVHRQTVFSLWRAPVEPPRDPRALLRLLLVQNFALNSATAYRRSVLDRIGGYDVRTPPCEDYELGLRAAAHGFRPARISAPLAVYRIRPGSELSNRVRHARRLELMYRIAAAELPLDDELRRLADARADETAERAAALEKAFPEGRRRALEPARALLRRLRYWRIRPPAELSRAFPDLRAV